MKKLLSAIVATILALVAFTACSSAGAANDKLKIVTTVFAEYDWVMNILGDNPAGAEVTMLLDNGADPHSFQPTVADIAKISSADLFIYVGGESDEWVADVLKEAVNKNMLTINLIDVLGDQVKEEEVVEGMEGEADGALDEHIWLSLKNAEIIVGKIAESIETLDSNNADIYKQNAASYIDKLNSLDAKYAEAVENANTKTLLFADRFPFRYLVDDYGLDYYAAFGGCSAETEASFETVTFLAKKIDELSIKTVLTIDGSDSKIAETIVSNTVSKDQQILTLDSIQSVKRSDINSGMTYLSIMESNLAVLKEALK
ncbi:MAG: metal ABC transporter substrate-binding protein [Saccharofermentans sp.]|nr:metal ABC transporter substrate-binding protein [Saccharofermentans sp.]